MSDAKPHSKTELTTDNLARIERMAVEAAGGQNRVLTLPGEPEGVYGVLLADGTIRKQFAERAPRRHRLLSVGEIAATIEHFAAIGGADPVPIVYYSPELVTVILDDRNDRPWFDRLEIELGEVWTGQWRIVRELHEQEYGQREFLDLLRRDLWDCIADATAGPLAKQVAALDWSIGSNTSSTIEKSRASYGRDVEAQVVSKHGEMPDDLVLSVRIFDDPALQQRRRVRCALEANPSRHTFRLTPFAGERERAMEQEMSYLSGILSADLSYPLILGKV